MPTVETVTVWAYPRSDLFYLNQHLAEHVQVEILKVTMDDGTVQYVRPVTMDCRPSPANLPVLIERHQAYLARKEAEVFAELRRLEDRASQQWPYQVRCLQRIGCRCPDCLG